MQPANKIVVVDTSVLINFLRIARLPLLGELPDLDFRVSAHVVGEITDPEQAAELREWSEPGGARVVQMADRAEIALYAGLRRTALHDGEAATLAIAETRGWLAACDEKGRFRREAETRIGPARILNTPTLLLMSILAGKLTVSEADRLKDELATKSFVIKIGSFAELLERAKGREGA